MYDDETLIYTKCRPQDATISSNWKVPIFGFQSDRQRTEPPQSQDAESQPNALPKKHADDINEWNIPYSIRAYYFLWFEW